MADRAGVCNVAATIGFESAQANAGQWALYQDGEFLTFGDSDAGARLTSITLSGQPNTYQFKLVVRDWGGRELFTREKTVRTACPADAPWYQPPLAGATGMCWKRTYSKGGEAHIAFHRTLASNAVGALSYPHRFGLNPDPANPGKYLQSGYSVPIENLSSVPHYVNTGNTRLYYFAYEGRRLPEGFFSVLGHVWSPDRGDTVERFWVDPSAQFLTNFGQRVDATDAEIQIAQWISAYDPVWGYTTAKRVWSDYYQGTFYVPGFGYVPTGLRHDYLSYNIHFNPTSDWSLTAAGQPPGFTVYDGVGKLEESLGMIKLMMVVTGLPVAPGQ